MLDKLRYKLSIFMQGRYGPDDLYKGCLILYLVLIIVNIFLASKLISALLYLLIIFVFFRFFSKNITKRQKENATYLIWKNKAKNSFDIFKKRFSDKEHVFRKCPHCKATLRLPRKKGAHTVSCPKCKTTFNVRILF